MAPVLSQAEHDMLKAMIETGCPNADIMKAVDCKERTVTRARHNVRLYGSTRVPFTRVGRHGKIEPVMQDALAEKLVEDPTMLLSEMVEFLKVEFDIQVSTSNVSRFLKRVGWSRKNSSQVGEQQNPMLRDMYQYKLSNCKSYQLIFIDESGQNRRTARRRHGWSAKGSRPGQKGDYSRGQTMQVLAAYTQEGIELAHVYPGTTNAEIFENFIEQLLQHCGRWPGPKSVLVMDNASIHHSSRVKELCDRAGVEYIFLSPYSPDWNPIEEYFSELKVFIRKESRNHEELFQEDFEAFVRLAVDIVGSRSTSAEGHFRHSGIFVEQAPKD